MDTVNAINNLLPAYVRNAINTDGLADAEEIRLRLGQCLGIVIDGSEKQIDIEVTENIITYVMEKATCASIYASMDTLVEGYVSYKGIRIGLCATAVSEGGRTLAVKNFSSLSIRIPHEYKNILDGLYCDINTSKGCLIISPPGAGKTTALRELIRCLSNDGYRISVADERNEIAAKDGSSIQNDIGIHTDVLTGMKKADAIMALLRSMTPQFIAVDEISRREDAAAILEAANCGVKFLATAHAESLNDLKNREIYNKLLKADVFGNIILVSKNGKYRSYELL